MSGVALSARKIPAIRCSFQYSAFRDEDWTTRLQVIEKMVRPERFELPTFWFVANLEGV
jgi:hypothetical protein